MAVTVKFLSAFQELSHSKKLFFLEKKRLDQIIDDLETQIPGIKKRLISPEGGIYPAYQLMHIKADIQEVCQTLDCSIGDGDEIVIIPRISGG
jgi:molybdopterin converting factor small subunit